MPSILRSYKEAERAVYKRASADLVALGRRLVSAWWRFIRGGSQSVSILIVAHSEEPPRGFRVTFFGLIGTLMLAAALIILAFAFSSGFGSAAARVSSSSEELAAAQAAYDSVEAQANRLEAAYQDVQAVLAPIMSSSGSHGAVLPAKEAEPLFGRRQKEAQIMAEIEGELDSSTPVIADYGSMLGKLEAVKRTVPAIWPIFGDTGHISTTFGYNLNPFTGQTYMHTGIDCSTYRSGDLIIATADGVVVFAGVEGGYGRCVVIAHSYGYFTRYGHMERILVHPGQVVKQGQGIGILGNTGVSTGPHTHYEVILGMASGYLDPMGFIWEGGNPHPIITGGGYGE